MLPLVADTNTCPETRPERVEIDRVGRIVGSAQPAAARRDRRLGIEDVVERPEYLDIAVVAAQRDLVRHGETEIGLRVDAIGRDAVLQLGVVTGILRPDPLDVELALADMAHAAGDVE